MPKSTTKQREKVIVEDEKSEPKSTTKKRKKVIVEDEKSERDYWSHAETITLLSVSF